MKYPMIRRAKKQDRDESCVIRVASIERLKSGDGADEVKTYKVSLSSEAPIRDWPWAPPNVLLHGENNVDLSGIKERGLPLYAMHRTYDLNSLIGRIINVRLERKRLVGELKFSTANPDAEMVRAMIDEGTLTDMSISAEPLKLRKVEEDGQVTRVEIVKWRPAEGSVVGIGADQAIGIGRQRPVVESDDEDAEDSEHGQGAGDAASIAANRNGGAEPRITRGTEVMDDVTLLATPDEDLDDEQIRRKKELQAKKEAQDKIDRSKRSQDENFAIEAEERRVRTIRNLGTVNKIGRDTVEGWINQGFTVDEVGDNIVEIVKRRGERKPESVAYLGLSDGESRQYSLCRAIVAAREGKWENAGFELECHKAIADKYPTRQVENGAFFVPLEVQRRTNDLSNDLLDRVISRHNLSPTLRRDLQVAGSAGYTVGTQIISFDQLLRNISFAFRMGVTRLSGLRDNVTIPRQNATATAEWLTSETDSPAESQLGFTQLPLTPKTVSAYTEISRQLLLQSSLDVEALVNADLAAVSALAVDVAVLSGSGGSGQPTGLDNVSGVGAVSGASLGLAGVLESQTDVATANVMPMRGGYVTTPTVAALLIAEVAYANTASPLWADPNGGDGPGNIWEGRMAGFPAMSTNQVAAATMYFGDWMKAVVAEWGVLEVQTNPYANFPSGIIGVRAMYSIDVGIRYPAAFSITTSIS